MKPGSYSDSELISSVSVAVGRIPVGRSPTAVLDDEPASAEAINNKMKNELFSQIHVCIMASNMKPP